MEDLTKFVEVRTNDGKLVLIETRILDNSLPKTTKEKDVLLGEKDVLFNKFSFSDIEESIQGISNSVLNALKRINPAKFSVELAFEVGVKEGQLMALLVKGEGKASIKVTLEWENKVPLANNPTE